VRSGAAFCVSASMPNRRVVFPKPPLLENLIWLIPPILKYLQTDQRTVSWLNLLLPISFKSGSPLKEAAPEQFPAHSHGPASAPEVIR
jgi:hypothetical protein